MMNIVLVQCVTCYVNSNSAQKAKNVCRILTGKVDNYAQLLLSNVDLHDCNVPREALPRAWIANSPAPKHEDGDKAWLFTTCSALWRWPESALCQVHWWHQHLACTDKEAEAIMPDCSKATKRSPKKRSCESLACNDRH